jgi:hypothetical protein
MYNIDIYNNDLSLTTVVKSPVSLVPIDAELEFKEIHTSATFIEKFNGESENYIIVGVETNLSTFVDNSPNRDDNYLVFYKNSLVTTSIIKRHRQIEEEYYFFDYENVKYAIERTANQDIIDIIQNQEFYYNPTTQTLIYYTINKIDAATFAAIKGSGSFRVIINNYRKELTIGNYDILTVSNDLNEILNTLTIDVEPTTSPPKKEGRMMFSSANYILINASRGKLVESLGFDIFPPASETGQNYKSWTIGNNVMVYGGVRDTSTVSVRYKIVSPGLINLLGERFCILRIKELEDHLYGSYGYMAFTPGIGMFKMAAGQGGITNIRFDYTSLVRKPFHPIGKIDKLTLRFETAKGNLYDFKGVNHQLMFVIKFLVPSKKEKFTKSILNPNYDPNIMQYLSNNRTIEYKEDSDDEEEFDEEEYYQMYKKQLDDLDVDTSSSEDSDYESSEEEVEE